MEINSLTKNKPQRVEKHYTPEEARQIVLDIFR